MSWEVAVLLGIGGCLIVVDMGLSWFRSMEEYHNKRYLEQQRRLGKAGPHGVE